MIITFCHPIISFDMWGIKTYIFHTNKNHIQKTALKDPHSSGIQFRWWDSQLLTARMKWDYRALRRRWVYFVYCRNVTEPKWELGCPLTPIRQIMEAEVGEKRKRSFLKGCTIWEKGRFLSQSPSPPGNSVEIPATLSWTKTKSSIWSSFCYLKYCHLGTSGSHWVVIQAAQLFSQQFSGIRLPAWTLSVGLALLFAT